MKLKEAMKKAKLTKKPQKVTEGEEIVVVKHNHFTRDNKPLGQCPACDKYHDKHIPKASDHPSFGDMFENPSASILNPHRFGWYVETINRKGKLNPGKHYRLTDKRGNFWEILAKDLVPLNVTPENLDSNIAINTVQAVRPMEQIHNKQHAVNAVMDLFFALREIKGNPTMRDLVKLAKRIKRGSIK